MERFWPGIVTGKLARAGHEPVAACLAAYVQRWLSGLDGNRLSAGQHRLPREESLQFAI